MHMKCNSCGMEVPDDKKFCPKCGTSLSSSEVHKMGRVCDNCGEEIPAGTKFCPNCGAVETEERCPKCGVIVSKNDPFCQNCGFDLRKKSNLDVAKDNFSEGATEVVSGVHNFLRDRKKDLDDYAESRRR